jgi:hypothetical protein
MSLFNTLLINSWTLHRMLGRNITQNDTAPNSSSRLFNNTASNSSIGLLNTTTNSSSGSFFPATIDSAMTEGGISTQFLVSTFLITTLALVLIYRNSDTVKSYLYGISDTAKSYCPELNLYGKRERNKGPEAVPLVVKKKMPRYG